MKIPSMDLSPLPAFTDLLPVADAEFLAVADTHLVGIRADHAREFGSRMKQNQRVAAALRVASCTGGGTMVHLGDLMQDYPESELHEGLLCREVAHWREVMHGWRFTAGNTDVGDQPDPSSPAAVAGSGSLARFARATGSGWTSMDVGDVRIVVLAASLINSGLDAEADQWVWLEQKLASAAPKRLVLCLHYPPFLRSARDPDVGNYDVINEPGRSRLIELIVENRVEFVFTGHSHFLFFNRIGRTRVFGLPFTSFTRPGFSEMFSSAAPPDRGRDDVAKLGSCLPGCTTTESGSTRCAPANSLTVRRDRPRRWYRQSPETFCYRSSGSRFVIRWPPSPKYRTHFPR